MLTFASIISNYSHIGVPNSNRTFFRKLSGESSRNRLPKFTRQPKKNTPLPSGQTHKMDAPFHINKEKYAGEMSTLNSSCCTPNSAFFTKGHIASMFVSQPANRISHSTHRTLQWNTCGSLSMFTSFDNGYRCRKLMFALSRKRPRPNVGRLSTNRPTG